MDNKFKVGDRVRVAKQSTSRLDSAAVVGDTGKVVKLSIWGTLLVDFDQARAQYNSNWAKETQHGYWCYPETLELLGSDLAAVTEKIIITTDGKTTTARRYKGKELLGSAKTVCSTSDTFDFERGAIIAFARLTDCDYELTDTKEPPKPEPKFKVGDVVKVKGRGYIGHCLIQGSIAVIKQVARSSHPCGGFSYTCEGIYDRGTIRQTVHENDLEKYEMPTKGE